MSSFGAVPPPPPSAPTFAEPAPQPPSKRSSRRWLIPVVAVLALAGIGAAAFAVLGGDDDSGSAVGTTEPATTGRAARTTATATTTAPPTTVAATTTSTSTTTSTTSTSTSTTSTIATTTTIAQRPNVAMATQPDAEGDKWESAAISIDGTSYPDSLLFSTGCSQYAVYEYAVPAGYKSFSTILGLTDVTPSNVIGIVEARLDGRREALSQVQLGAPAQMTFPVAGASRLLLEAYIVADGGDCQGNGSGVAMGQPLFVDADLPPASVAADDVATSRLANTDSVDSSCGSGVYVKSFQAQRINGAYALHILSAVRSYTTNSPTDCWIEYDLARSGGALVGTLGVTDDSETGFGCTLTVSADGQDLFSQSVALGSVAPVAVDLSGRLRLRLTFSLSGQAEGTCALAEARVTKP